MSSSSQPLGLVGQIALLQSLTHVIVRARDLTSTCEAALDGLVRILGASKAAVLLFDEAGTMRFVASRGLSDTYKHAVEGHTPWKPGEPEATPVVVSNVHHDPALRPYLDAVRAEGIAAMAFVPLVGATGVLGKIMVYFDAPHDFSPADVLLAQTVGQQVAFAVERRRIEGRLTVQKTLLEAQSEASADGILVVAPSGEIVSYNRAFVEMWKIPQSVIDSRSDEAAVAAVVSLLESPQSFVDRIRYLYDHPSERSRDELALIDGRRFERYSAPVVAGDGTDFGRVWFFRDLTDRIRAEEKLRAEHAMRKAIEESILAGVAAINHEGRQTYVNPAFCRMVGWEADALIGALPPFPYWPPEEIDRIGAALQRVISDEINSVELRFQRKSGERFDALVLISRLHGPQAVSEDWLACVYDITDRKRDERIRAELLEKEQGARAEAEAASRAKDEFLAMLSHELRTPVNALLGWTQILQDVQLDDDGRARAVSAIHRNAQIQAQLISDILDVSRIIKGKLPLSFELATVHSIVDEVVELFKSPAAAKRLVLRRSIPADIPPVFIDPARFQQVLWNLLSNAVKFTPEGGTIDVAMGVEDGALRLAVRDTGIGVSAEFLPHVFERYRQADGSATRSYGGLGLGLAIVRNIVEMHGGRVEARSEGAGRGAEFALTIPLRAAPMPDAGAAGASRGAES